MNIDIKLIDNYHEEIAYALNRSRKLSLNFLNFNRHDFYEKIVYIHKYLFQDLYSFEDVPLKCGYIVKTNETKTLLKNLSSELLDAYKDLRSLCITLANFLRKGGHSFEFKLPRDAFEKYFFNEEPLSTLDGIAFEEEVILVYLDVDYLTGLTFCKEFDYFAKYLINKNIDVLSFPEYAIEQNLRNSILLRAASSIYELRSFIEIVRNKYLDGKTPPTVTPKFFMSMSGVVSGKSNLKNHANVFCGNDLVRASLDSIRSKSKFYDFYLICDHHNDDYKPLIYFSYVTIASITNQVIKKGLNYFRDTSGIPYKDRNDNLIKIFEKFGYETFLLSAAAALYLDKNRLDLDEPIRKRIIKRYNRKKHTVPWSIVMKKHIDHPIAKCEAASDPHLDYLIIYDTMVPKNKAKILAKSVDISKNELEQLKFAKKQSHKALFDKLQELEITRFEELDMDFKINQIDYILNYFDAIKELYQILIIFNKVKMLDLIQKGALNVNAKGYEALVLNTFKKHIPELDYCSNNIRTVLKFNNQGGLKILI